MNTFLKNMMLALLSLGIGQAAWADDVPNLKEMLQAAEQGNAAAQYNLGVMYANGQTTRSEERRVGKECRSRWSPYH